MASLEACAAPADARVRDACRGVDQLRADGCGAGPMVLATGECAGGAGEVVGDRGADQPGRVRGEPPGG